MWYRLELHEVLMFSVARRLRLDFELHVEAFAQGVRYLSWVAPAATYS